MPRKTVPSPQGKEEAVYSKFLKGILFIIFREEKGRRKELNVWLLLKCPLLGTWPATQACALTGDQIGNPLVCKLAFNPLSYTSQGCLLQIFMVQCFVIKLWDRAWPAVLM